VEPGVTYARLDPDTDARLVPVRRALGVTSFGVNQLRLAPGQRGRIHAHERQEEVYLVLAGRLTLSIEGEERVLDEGELARVAPDVRRQLINRDAEPCVLLAVGGEGEHSGRDGRAYVDWDSTEFAAPQEIPLPSDVRVGERPAGG